MEYQHPIYGPRWTEQKLTSDTKPKVRYEYWATGRREFPFDMLRHDCAWPASGDDAAKLDFNRWECDIDTPEEWSTKGRQSRSVRLRSYQTPEVDRWRSFGWTISQFDLKL